MADRAYDGDDFRAWRAPRGTEAVLPARKGRTNPQPHDPERYQARHAIERGLGWLKQGRRVATRYDPYAHRGLGFRYWAGAWIWLQSYLNTAIGPSPDGSLDRRVPILPDRGPDL